MIRARRATGALALALLAAAQVGAAHAQGLIGLSRGSGHVGVAFLGRWSGTANGGMALDQTFREWLKLPFRGSLVHPRFATYTVTLSPTFSQSLSPSLPSALNSRSLGWDIGIRLFPRRLVSASFATSRASGSTRGGIGSTGEFTNSSTIGTLNLNGRFVTARLTYSNRLDDNDWLAGPGLVRTRWSHRNELLQLVADTRTLHVAYDRLRFADRLNGGDYTSTSALVSHELRWGLGSRLRSSWERADRVGASTYRRQVWREQLTIRHSRATTSNLYFARRTAGMVDAMTTNQVFGFGIDSRVAPWLWMGVGATARSTRFDGLRESIYTGGPAVGLDFRLPAGVRLTARGSFGLEHRSQRFQAGKEAQVVDERHRVDETQAFVLDRPGAVAATVMLRDAANTIEYIVDFDYRVVELDGVIEIVITPESRIKAGDVLLVTYRYAVIPAPPGDLITGRYTVTAGWRWINVRHVRSLRDPGNGKDAVTPGLGALDDSRTSVTALFATPLGPWRIDLGHDRRRSVVVDYSTYEARTDLGLPPIGGVRAYLGAAARHAMQRDRALDSRSAHLAFDWNLGRPARFHGRLETIEIDLHDGQRDRSFGATLDVTLHVAAIELLVQMSSYRKSVPTVLARHYVSARLTRRF